jgi:hypothetical protein
MIEIDDFYLSKPEPLKGCLLSLRDVILRSGQRDHRGVEIQHAFLLFSKKDVLLHMDSEKNFCSLHWNSGRKKYFSPQPDPGKQVKDENIVDRSNERPTGQGHPYDFEKSGAAV